MCHLKAKELNPLVLSLKHCTFWEVNTALDCCMRLELMMYLAGTLDFALLIF